MRGEKQQQLPPYLVLFDSPRAVLKPFPAYLLESRFLHLPPTDPNSLSLSGARELALVTSSQVTPMWLGRGARFQNHRSR